MRLMGKPEWQKQEARVAKAVGAKVTKGSGSGWLHVQDVKDDRHQVLWEMKQTARKDISVKGTAWEQLRSNANAMGFMPALSMQIGEGRTARRLCVIDEADLIELLEMRMNS